MRTLITGGAGFIGINLAKKILETGEDVVVVDNFFRPGTLQNFKWLEEQQFPGNLSVISLDVRIDWKRLKKIIDEIVSARRMIILFIDEIHILAEAGEAEGAINAADILKPMLARGELQVVGATTKEEYEKYIKMDKTLDRRLQPIFVSEPNAKEVKEILIGIKNVYEEYHQVNILPSAIDEAIKSTKFITSRSYPDKAIDAIDEASSRVRLEVTRSEKNANKIPEVSDKEIKLTVAQWKNN